MTLQEAVESCKPFKAITSELWLIADKTKNRILFKHDNTPKTIVPSDFFLDYEIKEQWYEGDFKKKWPKGVLCWVWDDLNNDKQKRIVVDYDPKDELPFITYSRYIFKYAEPIKPEEAPAIITD